MSVTREEVDGSAGIVDAYARRVAGLHGVDELVADVVPRPSTSALAATVDLLGAPGLLTRRAEAIRLIEDDGVTYGTAPRADDGTPMHRAPARWKLDPLPIVIDAAQWQALEHALRQRTELLDRILGDLYGPRELLRRGIVPPEVVLGHSGFLRVADRIRLPGPRQLFLAAADLARDESGDWTVIGDRTQAPSGAGYAMENRRIVARVMPALHRDTSLERLRDFFHTMRAGLQEIAPPAAEAPRVVLLTPGPGSETAFDQSFLSTLLGYPVVSGEDLVVRGGRVHLRTVGRLEPVDVVLRRVDAWFADPLELRPQSRLGVAGLLEAARLGTVSVVNTFGAGVLENPGLLPYLPAACAALLGEPLRLPSVPTWWCGDDVGRSHALAHLERLVVKPISRGVGRTSLFGWELTEARLDQLRRRIEAEPHGWCVQEPITMSTAPVVTRTGLEPRRLLLRTFAVSQGGGYRLMAGGLARVAAHPDSTLVSNETGALAKDVWVLAPRPAVAPPTMVRPPSGRRATDAEVLPGRASAPVEGAPARPRPIPEPIPAAVPEPPVESIPAAVPEPPVESIPAAVPEPSLEPIPDHVSEPIPGSVPASIPEPVPEPEPWSRPPASLPEPVGVEEVGGLPPSTHDAWPGDWQPGAPSSRTAEDLFWLGRYAERAEDAVRLLRVVDDLAEDWSRRPGTPGRASLQVLLGVLTRVTTTFPGFVADGADARLAAPQAELRSLVVDDVRPGTLAHAVGRTIEAAHAVRDQLSLDTWVVLGSLQRVLDDVRTAVAQGIEQPLQPPLARMLESLLALAGLGAESMVRDAGWHYLDAGRRLERALHVTALLRHALAAPLPPAVEAQVLESVLIAAESIITYRRRHQARPRPGTVVDLLMRDRGNPRSVAHALDRLADDVQRLPSEAPGAAAAPSLRQRLAGVSAAVRELDTVAAQGMSAAVDDVHRALADFAEALERAHFVHAAQHAIAGTPGWDA